MDRSLPITGWRSHKSSGHGHKKTSLTTTSGGRKPLHKALGDTLSPLVTSPSGGAAAQPGSSDTRGTFIEISLGWRAPWLAKMAAQLWAGVLGSSPLPGPARLLLLAAAAAALLLILLRIDSAAPLLLLGPGRGTHRLTRPSVQRCPAGGHRASHLVHTFKTSLDHCSRCGFYHGSDKLFIILNFEQILGKRTLPFLTNHRRN